MKKILSIFVMSVLFITCLAGCGASTDDSNRSKELTNSATYEKYELVLNDSSVETLESGEKVIRVRATFKNNDSEPIYALSAFAVTAFQNDKQIDDASDINGTETDLIKEVKDGQTIEVSYVFKLADDSEVEVLIGEPTADQNTIGKAVYNVE